MKNAKPCPHFIVADNTYLVVSGKSSSRKYNLFFVVEQISMYGLFAIFSAVFVTSLRCSGRNHDVKKDSMVEFFLR
jgi:hypothetical protein